MLTKEELLDKLRSGGVQFDVHEHAPVLTVQAQTEVLSGIPGTVVKNLFAKDKRNRLYIISALPTTKIDMNSISMRLGTGKGGLRFAPEELMGEVLKVPPGSVTPLAVANPEASQVVLFLDHHLRSHPEPLLVHPLVNTASLAMQPAALDQAIRVLGREPIYVDYAFEAKIDKDTPPDLVKYTVEPAPKQPASGAAAPAAAPAATATAGASSTPAGQQAQASTSGKAPSNPKQQGKDKDKGAKPAGPSMYAQHQAATDVAVITEEVLNTVTQSLMGKDLASASAGMDSYVLLRLKADVQSQLNTLKNTAYTMGYGAGKGAVVGYAQKQFA